MASPVVSQEEQHRRRLRQLGETQSRVRRELAKRKLIHFAKWTMPDYEASWHHTLLADTLDRVRTGEISRLLVFMPPQHGKSELISRRWPAHLLGIDPNIRIIATSYNEELARFNGRQVRRILRGDRCREVFGERATYARKPNGPRDLANRANYFEMPYADGYYLGVGIMGGMTGYGYDIGIVDDPIKNSQEADSPAYRKRLIEAWEEVFLSRGRGKTRSGMRERIVAVFTRWRYDDLAGHILETAKKAGEQWHVLCLPALLDEPVVAEEGAAMVPGDPRKPGKPGEPLWPDRYDVASLLARKRKISYAAWESMYQQRPAPGSGTIFRESWWRYYDQAPADLDMLWQSWDGAFHEAGTSRVCGIVFGSKGADVHILDLVVEHMSYVEFKDAIRAMSRKWPMAYPKVVEYKANGPAVISDLRSELGGLIPWPESGEPMGSKVERWNAASPFCRAGNVYLPRDGTWVDEFKTELKRVPKGLYDDQADAFAQGVLWKLSAGGFPGW